MKKIDYSKMSMAEKLKSGFGGVTRVLIILGVISAVGVICMNMIIVSVFNGPFVCSVEAMGIRRDINALGKNLRSAIMYQDASGYSDTINENRDSIYSRLDTLDKKFSGDKTNLNALQNSMAALMEQRDLIAAAAQDGDWDKAQEILFSTYEDDATVVVSDAIALYDDIEADATNSEKRAVVIAVAIFIAIIALIVYSVAYSKKIAKQITKLIVDPIDEMVDASKAISEGNLDHEIKYHSEDELGKLAHELRKTVKNLKLIINDVGYVL